MKKTSLVRQSYSYMETKGTIVADSNEAVMAAKLAVQEHRRRLEKYILQNPLFLYSLEPAHLSEGPTVVKKMAEASEKAGVGPMAAVAGVLADLAVDTMIMAGAEVAVVENGGEASAISNIPIDIALLAGNNVLSKRLGFRLEHFPMGVATSSGKFSHALSFGDADAVTIFAENAGLADAAATAAANVVKGNDLDEAIKCGIYRAMSIEGVKGVFILFDDKVGQAGDIPKIVSIVDAIGA